MEHFLQPIENKKFDEIIDKLGDNNKIVRDILNLIGNFETKIVLDNELNSSYYVFLNDTIYIADNIKNNSYYRVCLLAHECIHSMQNKILQILNFAFSNLELVLFCFCLVVNIIFKHKFIFALNLIYFTFNIANIIVRLILEINAVNNSILLSERYLKDKITNEYLNLILNQYKREIKKLYPFFIINLFFNKVIRFLVIFIIFYCKFL